MKVLVPDIYNGCMIHGIGIANEWITEIQSVFETSDGDQTLRAFLAHECRHERVLGSYRDVHNKGFIFDIPWETAAIVSWRGTHLMHAGAGRLPLRPFRPGAPRMRNYDEDAEARYYKAWKSEVIATEIEASTISFDSLCAILRCHELNEIRSLYILLSFTKGGKNIRILAPARYINYSARDDVHYLQPISGRCLNYDGSFKLCYVSCNSHDGDQWHIEICNLDLVNVLTLHDNGMKSRLANMARRMPYLGRLFTTEEFSSVEVHSGRCDFIDFRQVRDSQL